MVLDRLPGGDWAAGGPSLYTARTALALGARVTLVTNFPAGYPAAALAGLDVLPAGSGDVPRYANTYSAAGDRTQLLLAEGAALDVRGLEGEAYDVLIVAPAYHELAAIPPVDARVVAIELQGLLRDCDESGRVVPHADPLAQVRPFIRAGALAFLSEEDTGAADALAGTLAAEGMAVLLTRGYRGAHMFEDGTSRRLAAMPADPVDPTGAGDCFATAFAVRYAECGDLAAASRFALAAGALAVEGRGIEGIPTRAAVEARLAKVAA
ncbi:MAG: hypothetical protein IT303_15320 [Dehalococcoidia bacterium]|nr:hypothetical protein [Dehalococcoidia bacterium]